MIGDRSCTDCTMCCEGWLSGDAYGHKFYPGKSCIFLQSNKCAIYQSRPKMCKDFVCQWKIDSSIPQNFKPNIVNYMIIKGHVTDIEYFALIGNNKTPDYTVINYFIQKQLNGDIENLVYTIDGNNCIRGTRDFEKAFSRINFSIITPTCK
jgi:hypothetical protein